MPKRQPKATRIPSAPSVLEETLALQIRAMALPEPIREYEFDTTRNWRADFAWPSKMILVECQGGASNMAKLGRHNRPEGYQEDCRRLNAAQVGGYRMFYFTGDMIESGEAIEFLCGLFGVEY